MGEINTTPPRYGERLPPPVYAFFALFPCFARPRPVLAENSRVCTVLFEHLYGFKMPGAHTALGDVHGLESVLSAPGISERWVGVRVGERVTWSVIGNLTRDFYGLHRSIGLPFCCSRRV